MNRDTLILLGLLLLPILIPMISKLEFGGLKLELRRLRNEVAETKNEVRKDVAEVRETYRQLNARLIELANRTADYLKPQPLEISERKVKEMEDGIFRVPLADSDVQQALSSFDPEMRIPGYLELRIRPRPPFFEQILDCVWLELFYARRHPKHYTRPLWQVLRTVGRFYRQDEKYPRDVVPQLSEPERRRAFLMLKHVSDVLESDAKLDPGCQCKRVTERIVQDLSNAPS